MPATMCCHDLLMRNAMLSAYTPMTTCGSAVDAGGAVGPYCLTLADEDILAKNEIVDPSIGLQKRKEWLLLTTPEGERYRQAERAARHQNIRRYL
ncbi:uncharacterized protein LOC115331645 isoform X1 [Ixodes scapularis]|uniref:uncharacterized protein LOC115331645 isoform X1 n=1 Tax=Ixodes scapularis TaxID=6945 RepID=UPI001C38742B|nr:uncharacterized protein LOC115331645 isoform X1 [Ixodes scapularis]